MYLGCLLLGNSVKLFVGIVLLEVCLFLTYPHLDRGIIHLGN